MAAMLYIRKGMPELIAPNINTFPNLPLKTRLFLIKNIMTAKPISPKKTRKKAVLIAPISGEAMRMKRKLAPQIAAKDSSRI